MIGIMEGFTFKKHVPLSERTDEHMYFQALFREHPDAILTFDRMGELTQANSAAEMLFGASADGLRQNLTYLLLFVPEERSRAQAYWQQVLQGAQQRFETAVASREQQPLAVQITLIPLRLADEVTGAYLMAQDITERRLEQQKWRENETLYRLLSENSQDMISYVTMDGICRYVSPAVQHILGYAPEEFIGNRPSDTFHPDDAADWKRHFEEKKLSFDSETFTYRMRHQDGHYVWVEMLIKTVRNEDGEDDVVLGIGRDVTARKRAEEELRTMTDQLETFIEYTVDAVVILNLEGMVVRVNQAYENMFGWPGQEVIGKQAHEQPNIPEHIREEVIHHVRAVKSGQAVEGHESTRLRQDGTLLDVFVTTAPNRDSEGRVTGWLVTFRDITERKKTQELLLQSEKLSIAGQLAAGVAHEIRNPLTALKGFVQLMKMSGQENETYLDVMSSELSRIELIVSELLVLAKPQANTFRSKDVTRLLQDVATLIETQAIMSNIQVQTMFEPDLPWVDCDENQLKQVFINFLKNAIEAMQKGGVIQIEAKKLDEQQVLLRFIDQGCGIPEELVKRIGEPFYTTKEKGTGLGMMVSKKIIESHGGRMHIQSEVNVGTTIELVLPCVSLTEQAK